MLKHMLLKIKAPKGDFHRDAIEEPFWLDVNKILISEETFFIINKLLWNGKVLRMLKIIN